MSEAAIQSDGYEFWRAALSGIKVGSPELPVHDSDAQCGFYRRRTHRAGPFVPVAIWRDGSALISALYCLVDGRPADAAEQWSFVCRYPVTEEQYRQRVETGRWHDEAEALTESLAHDARNSSVDEAELLRDQIEAAAAGATTYAEIKDDETAPRAQGLRSRLLELSGEADKKRKAEKKPHLEAGRQIDAKWQPLVKVAKGAADAIRAALGAHETRKANEAARLRKIAEDKRIATERAAALAKAEAELAGRPVSVPPMPEPTPVPAPMPEQATTVRGAYGRAAAVRPVSIAIIEDQDKVYGACRDNSDVAALLAKLAQRALDAGITLPGVSIRTEMRVS